MFKDCKTSKDQGNIGLGDAIAYFTRNVVPISLPISDNVDYDLVIDEGISLKKIQCKTTDYKAKGRAEFTVHLDTTGSNGKMVKKAKVLKYDYLYVLTSSGDRYFIPKTQLNEVSQVSLGKKYQQFRI